MKIPVRLILFRVPLSLESEIRPIKCQNMSSLTSKTQIKKSSVCFAHILHKKCTEFPERRFATPETE